MRVIMHINYMEQGQSIDEICERSTRLGFDGVEFRRKRTGVEETPAQYLEAIARGRDAHGMKNVLFGGPGPDLMQPDASVRARELEESVAFYRAAVKHFDLKVNNIMSGSLVNRAPGVPAGDFSKHGSFCATDDHYAWAAEGFKALGAVAAEFGFVFAFETHMNYLHDMPASTMKMVAAIGHPAVGVNLDYGNISYMPAPPTFAECLDTIGDRLYYVHLKNVYVLKAGTFMRVGLAEGQLNHRQMLRALKERGYAGMLCVEAPRPGDREWFARQDLAYIRAVLEDLEY